jgi:hypothetical protein
MSSELKTILKKVAEEDFKSEETIIDERIRNYKSLILKIAEVGTFDLPVWIEGSQPSNFKKYERDLNMLERGNLIKGEMKYTERNAYRQYKLTKKGIDLAKKLQGET